MDGSIQLSPNEMTVLNIWLYKSEEARCVETPHVKFRDTSFVSTHGTEMFVEHVDYHLW